MMLSGLIEWLTAGEYSRYWGTNIENPTVAVIPCIKTGDAAPSDLELQDTVYILFNRQTSRNYDGLYGTGVGTWLASLAGKVNVRTQSEYAQQYAYQGAAKGAA